MVTFTRLLLGLLVLGVVGMHGLVFEGGTGAPHHSFVAQASSDSGVPLRVPGQVAGHATGHDHTAPTAQVAPSTLLPSPGTVGEGDLETTALALCLALLLTVAAAAAGARRTTWTRTLDRVLPRRELPTSPWLRDRTPVPRFTVMRC